jgi:hypothetical protein
MRGEVVGNRDWAGVAIGLAIAVGAGLMSLVAVSSVQTFGGVGVVFPGLILFGLWKAAKSFATIDATWVEDGARERAEVEMLRRARTDATDPAEGPTTAAR